MGKKVRKKSRGGHKQKHVSTITSAKDVTQEDNRSTEVVHDGASAEKERKVCIHLEKAVDLAKVSSKIKYAKSYACEDCREGVIDRRAGKGKGKHSKKKGVSDLKAESKATWVCLQCGHFSCGGIGLPTSPHTHAVRHARQSRHPLIAQVENPHLRWCFSCSMPIPVEKPEDSGVQKDALSEIVKLLKKQPSQGKSMDVEDIWFGSGSVVSELKSENKECSVVNGKDTYAVRGLVNLGNTCFFNSVMQNLLAMDILREYLLKFDGSMGPMTSALKKIFIETSPETGQRNAINPKSLFGFVCAKAPQFRGYQQQDSHELLRYLLDGLSTEDLCAKKSNSYSLENGGSLPVRSNFVDDIFGGQLSSTVRCVECGYSSVVYEPFLDLSLPVPTKKPPSKKAQSVPRARKTKLPPKRGGRTRQKLNKDGDSGPILSGCDPSTSNESSSELKGASPGCSSSGEIAEPGHLVDGNAQGLVPQNSISPAEQDSASAQVLQSDGQKADSSDWLDYLEPVSQSASPEAVGLAWLDYLEPVSLLDDQNWAAENEDLPVSQDSGSREINHNNIYVQDAATTSGEVSTHPGDPNLKSEYTFDDFRDERPFQVRDNEILLLTYKEDTATAVEGPKIDAEISSSFVSGGEDTLGIDGLGDLFNEPEDCVPLPSVANNSQGSQHLGNGCLAGNSSESDPDEVDNTDSPVSIESCLAHFIKPELLSNEHAWHCENCSKILLEKRRKMRKSQLTTASGIQRDISSEELSSSAALEVNRHSSPDCSAVVFATCNNGSCNQDENLKNLDTRQINGVCPSSPQEEEKSCRTENAYLHAPVASVSSIQSSKASLDDKSIGSHTELSNHVPLETQSGLDEKQESGDNEEEVDSESVKVRRDATKRILVNKAPPIMTVHLKRFGQDARGRLSKLNGHIGFKEFIDLGPYMDHRSTERDDCIYSLIGVVQHSGSMRGGHYIAYVRGGNRLGRRPEEENNHRQHVWYHVSDAYVRETTLDEVLRCEAYILFYEKVTSSR